MRRARGRMDELVKAISDYRSKRALFPGQMELEVRLGSRGDTFCPGVTESVFVQLEKDLDQTLSNATRAWQEIVDYFYVDAGGRHIRTRVQFDSNKMTMHTQHHQKESHHCFLAKRAEGGGEEAARATINREEPVSDPPVSCVPTHVRIQQRRTWRDVRDGATVWAYELSRTWSANTRSGVEHKKHASDPVYEVECELVDENGAYVDRLSDEQIAASMLLKTRVLLGEEVENDTPLVVVHERGLQGPRERRLRGRKLPPEPPAPPPLPPALPPPPPAPPPPSTTSVHGSD